MYSTQRNKPSSSGEQARGLARYAPGKQLPAQLARHSLHCVPAAPIGRRYGDPLGFQPISQLMTSFCLLLSWLFRRCWKCKVRAYISYSSKSTCEFLLPQRVGGELRDFLLISKELASGFRRAAPC